jgi:hypothetical protein
MIFFCVIAVYGLDDWGLIHDRRLYAQTGSGVHPACNLMDTGGSIRRVKLTGVGSCHSPPSSSEVKNAFSYTSISAYVFIA